MLRDFEAEHRTAGDIASAELAVSRSYYAKRDFSNAFAYVDDAIRNAQASGDTALKASACAHKATLFNWRGQSPEAIPEWAEVAELAKKCGDIDRLAEAVTNEGSNLLAIGDVQRAYPLLRQGFKASKRAEVLETDREQWRTDRSWAGDSLESQAQLLSSYGQYDKALDLMESAQKESADGAINNSALLLVDRGTIYGEKAASEVNLEKGKDNVKAVACFESALLETPIGADSKLVMPVRLGYGSYLLSQNQYAAATELYDEGLITAEGLKAYSEQAECLLGIGFADVGLNSPRAAVRSFDQAGAVIRQWVPTPLLRWRLHHGLGLAYRRLASNRKALNEFNQAVSILNEWFKTLPELVNDPVKIDQSYWAPFEDAIDANLESRNVSRAFELSEQAKTGLMELATRSLDVTKGLSKRERVEEEEYRRRVREIQDEIGAEHLAGRTARQFASQLGPAQSKLDAFESGLCSRHPALRASRARFAQVGFSGAQQVSVRLKSKIIDFVVTVSQVLAFVIEPSGVTRISLPISPDELTEDIELIAKRMPAEVSCDNLLELLYSKLIGPIESRGLIRRFDELCIVPDRELWKLPFDTLEPRPGHYLRDDNLIVYAPSVSAEAQMLELASSPLYAVHVRVAALGGNVLGGLRARSDPTRGSITLKANFKELDIFPGLFGSNAHVFRDAAATSAAGRLALEDFDITHFACHGKYNEADPMESYLCLAATQGMGSEFRKSNRSRDCRTEHPGTPGGFGCVRYGSWRSGSRGGPDWPHLGYLRRRCAVLYCQPVGCVRQCHRGADAPVLRVCQRAKERRRVSSTC